MKKRERRDNRKKIISKLAILLIATVLVLSFVFNIDINLLSIYSKKINALERQETVIEDKYDVILFWGQSNMVGSCGVASYNEKVHDIRYYDENNINNYYFKVDETNYYSLKRYLETYNELTEEQKESFSLTADMLLTNDEKERISLTEEQKEAGTPQMILVDQDALEISEYSKLSGIEEEFLRNSEQMNYVRIEQTDNTVFEFEYLTKKIVEINDNTRLMGEYLKYNEETGKLEAATSSSSSIVQSKGTNLIPQFCKTYYEKTGHKVVAVFAAKGGQKIANYLPSDKLGEYETQYIYEAMKEKYNAALEFLGDKVGNKLYVCFQGETDVLQNSDSTINTDGTPEVVLNNDDLRDNYAKTFKVIHDRLKADLGIEHGTIIESGYKSAEQVYPNRLWDRRSNSTLSIHNAKVKLSNENNDIIIGSSYALNHYLPNENIYEIKDDYGNYVFLPEAVNDENNRLDYNSNKSKLYQMASFGFCYNTVNAIHLTSAALCQIGKETALNLLAEKYGKIVDTTGYQYPSRLFQNVNIPDGGFNQLIFKYSSAEPVKIKVRYTFEENVAIENYDSTQNKIVNAEYESYEDMFYLDATEGEKEFRGLIVKALDGSKAKNIISISAESCTGKHRRIYNTDIRYFCN